MSSGELDLDVYVNPERLAAARERQQADYAYAVKAREHLWTVIVQHAITREALERIDDEPPTLDHESILGNPVIGCYICEELFEPRMLRRRCKGEPRPRPAGAW